jgi:DNA gyrase subunit A
MIAIQTSERNGKVVGAVLVEPNDEIMLITTGGVLVRTRVGEIREMGRATQGVTLIAVDEGTTLSRVQRVVERDAAENGDAELEAAAANALGPVGPIPNERDQIEDDTADRSPDDGEGNGGGNGGDGSNPSGAG